jgi:hypothetical protein
VVGRATIEHDLRGQAPVVRVVDNPRGWAVLVGASPLAPLR